MSTTDICFALAKQMAAHINANQNPSYRVTAKAWRGGDVVRVYTNKDSYAAIYTAEDEDGDVVYRYKHVGKDRGSVCAIEAAWDAAEVPDEDGE